VRVDRPWGPALEIEISGEDGSLRNNIIFGCHPEQPDYDRLRVKRTGERLSSGAYEETLRQARQSGLKLILSFSSLT
jgi:hypothetical protein